MASNDFQKMKGSVEAKAGFRHTTKDWRANHKHTNKHIDTTLTYLNTSISGLTTGHELTYDEMCALYDERIAYLDTMPKQNKRKDRVEMFTIETPAPKGLPPEKEDEWFMKVADIEKQMWGEDNYLDGHIDRDEQHEYLHPETGRMEKSRVHMNSYIFAADAFGHLCAKQMTKRSNIIRLNNLVEEMTYRDYGLHFMTGAKTKSRKTVEQLKRESEVAEIERTAQMLEEAAQNIKDAREEYDQIVSVAEKDAAEITATANEYQKTKMKEVKAVEKLANEKMSEAARKQSDVNRALAKESKLTERENRVIEAEVEIENFKMSMSKRTKAVDEREAKVAQREQSASQKELSLERATQALPLLQNGQVSWQQIVFAVLSGVMGLCSQEEDREFLKRLSRASQHYPNDYIRATLAQLVPEPKPEPKRNETQQRTYEKPKSFSAGQPSTWGKERGDEGYGLR